MKWVPLSQFDNTHKNDTKVNKVGAKLNRGTGMAMNTELKPESEKRSGRQLKVEQKGNGYGVEKR